MIYPVPQKTNLNGTPLDVKSLSVTGDFAATAEKVFDSYNLPVSGGYGIVIKCISNQKTTYINEISRLTDEKYIITVSENEAVIEASCEKGIFRAAHTLAKLIKNNEIKTGEIEDYPLFKKRGYIEGFYGNTWENGKRVSVMKLMAANGMNTFFYAPKDDLYHREKWRELYPEKELLELKALFETAQENFLDFHWAVGPGLTYKYSSDYDFEKLIAKFMSLYDIGIRNFGLLLDDIPWEFQYEEDAKAFSEVVEAHVYLINKTYTALKKIDPSITLTVCPTQYSGDENGYYISKFGSGIPVDVDLFWTGAEICSRVQTVREADELMRSTKHRPLYWDNYPVNDCEMYHELHMGALIGREKDLYMHCEGLISNVMEYAECSKIPLMTVADYLWNPLAYNPDASLKNAHKVILGDNAELFGYFADHLGVSCLSKYSSAFMSEKLSHIAFLESCGKKDEALACLAEYNANMRKCLALISDTSTPLFEEMQKWVRKFAMCCDLLDAIYDAHNNPCQQTKETLSSLLEEYNSDSVVLTGFCLREAAEKTLKSLTKI